MHGPTLTLLVGNTCQPSLDDDRSSMDAVCGNDSLNRKCGQLLGANVHDIISDVDIRWQFHSVLSDMCTRDGHYRWSERNDHTANEIESHSQNHRQLSPKPTPALNRKIRSVIRCLPRPWALLFAQCDTSGTGTHSKYAHIPRLE